jgi:predicted DNA binding CopG/RHH family protein
MRKEYDFSKAKKNPYAGQLKKQVTIRLDERTVEYFKKLAKTGIPYQTLIGLTVLGGRKLDTMESSIS